MLKIKPKGKDPASKEYLRKLVEEHRKLYRSKLSSKIRKSSAYN